ncbi:MAG: MFS transporter [Thermoflexales bacterium]
MTSAPMSALPRGLPGYVALLRGNPNVRNLWAAQSVSQLGDWFNSVALLGLIISLTNSPISASLTVVFQMLPAAITSVFIGGYIADRFDRKKVMVAADIARAVIALGFILIRGPEWVWLAYAGTLFLSLGSAFFDPAMAAALPNLCRPGELLTANALQQSTWASGVFVGAALGGVVAQVFGRDAAFIINALSFLWSAWFLSRIRGRFRASDGPVALSGTGALRVLTDGFRFLGHHPRVLMISLAKPIWALALGGIGLFSVYAYNVYRVGDIGTSWLYVGRGLGSFVGPLITTSLFQPKTPREFVKVLGLTFVLCALGYTLFGLSETPLVGALSLVVGHIGGASVWAFSRIFVQHETPDALRGRVLAVDSMGFSVVTSISTLIIGTVATATTPAAGILTGVGATVVAGVVWVVAGLRLTRGAPEGAPRPQ